MLAHRFATPPTLDGDAGEWAAWPATEVALAAARAGRRPDRPGLVLPVEDAPQPGDRPDHRRPGLPRAPARPDAPPATAAEGSAGCSIPLPPFDHGVASVQVRAGFDDQDLYLLLQWSAPARHDVQQPWSWDAVGKAWRPDRSRMEDAAYVSFAIGDGVHQPRHPGLRHRLPRRLGADAC